VDDQYGCPTEVPVDLAEAGIVASSTTGSIRDVSQR